MRRNNPSAATDSLTVVDTIAAELRADIRNGVLRPGDPIRQDVIAKRHGTSRIPVREALRELSSEGRVIIRPNAGARVAELNLADLREVYLLRERLEPFAAGIAVSRLDEQAIAKIAHVLEDLTAMRTGDARFHELDLEFHHLIYQACDMPRLVRMIESLWETSQQYRNVYSWLPGEQRLEVSHLEHQLILDAIRRSSPEDVSALVALHIRRTRLTFESMPQLLPQDGG
ncbi:GntR family transcriptional regulator [Streptosporangium sp. NPDC051023]|uniref:GntR family transcriptional regulator n=1 Tax=Streptosporangium sp. NPDC051023 TaxID=3155410 RepID=UPI0034502BB8